MTDLTQDSINFGKYKHKTLSDVLKDRSYCKWLLLPEQDWFKTNYEYLHNKVSSYNPLSFFLKPEISGDFIDSYKFFNLFPLSEIGIVLTNEEKLCYSFYLSSIQDLKNKILLRIEKCLDNPYDIKAPTKWLQKFETDTGLTRDKFKSFIDSYDLPNIPYIIEDIKKAGGIVYNGANSFKIAKKNSLDQEKYWEDILKSKYGEDLTVQYKYNECIFDFLNISTSTIFECKLGLKDFNEEQHKKYLIALTKYRIVYLISTDCVIHMDKKVIYTTDVNKYAGKIKIHPKFEELISEFAYEEIEDLTTLFGN